MKFKKFVLCAAGLTTISLSYVLVPLLLDSENRPPVADGKNFITFFSTERWGMGNEMYALASTIGINNRTGGSRVICFNKNVKIRKFFDLSQFPKCSSSYLKDGLSALTFHEANYAKYDPLVNNLPANHHIILDRFFQSWKYFNVENEFIRNTVFKFHKDIDFAAEQRLKQGLKYLEKEKCKHPCFDVQIAVHIRRKNLDQKHLRDLGYTTPPIEYYKSAMEFFLKKYKYLKSVFVVSSDDIKWAKFNLVSITDRLIFIQSNHPAIDMAILSKCNHTIISVGTFGWWSAWLANGTTVYYKDWPIVGSSLYEGTNHDDYFPSSWIPM